MRRHTRTRRGLSTLLLLHLHLTLLHLLQHLLRRLHRRLIPVVGRLLWFGRLLRRRRVIGGVHVLFSGFRLRV